MPTPVTIANFSPSVGWGTGASITSVTGTDHRCTITVTAGTTPALQPQISFTYPGIYPVAPLSMAWMTGGTGQVSDISNTTTNGFATFTYDGLPVAGKTYIITIDTLGI